MSTIKHSLHAPHFFKCSSESYLFDGEKLEHTYDKNKDT